MLHLKSTSKCYGAKCPRTLSYDHHPPLFMSENLTSQNVVLKMLLKFNAFFSRPGSVGLVSQIQQPVSKTQHRLKLPKAGLNTKT